MSWNFSRAVAFTIALLCATVTCAHAQAWVSEVAGFRFGWTSPHTGAVCAEAGHQWRRIPQFPQWEEYDYLCTGAAGWAGFPVQSVSFGFTRNTLTIVSLRSIAHQDVRSAARDIAGRLTSRYGVPSSEDRASGTRIWSFSTGSQIHLALSREPDRHDGDFTVTYIRHDHVPPEPSRDLLPEPGL